MRNGLTNLLQVVVLLTGIVYIIVGGLYIIKPELFCSIFQIPLNTEWSNQIRIDDYLMLLYLLSKSFAIVITFIGASMVMPLYDPERYRELIYFNGVFLPVILLGYMLKQFFSSDYNATIFISLVFLVVAILNMTCLYLTKKKRNR
ncbi:MAG: hypothetical protein JXK07_08370 [Spirochaetes bacterium]|nr:hypothetical protein [Spirochaetota bacterium]MBN2772513.1 hypothetical protein [Spirochaetota bacterium]